MELEGVVAEVSKVIRGKEDSVVRSLVCLLAEGHLLIEDVPGVGKTTLALGLARALDLTFARIQFTSDLLPSDISGTSIYDQAKREFVFKAGPIFNNVVLADEINRATPKTQSALLEAMAERQVTVDGRTYELPRPFFVIATQNPLEHYGTYPLPESQLDRFMMRISIGYPDRETEREIIRESDIAQSLDGVRTAVSRDRLIGAIEEVKKVFISEEVGDFIRSIAYETRMDSSVVLGVSTRGAVYLAQASRALAYIRGRDFVVPEDVIELAPYVLSHRLITREDVNGEEVIRKILSRIEVPR